MCIRRIEPPSWWNANLYSYLHDLPKNGWVWEFMRRNMLQEKTKGGEVDVMNPIPNLGNIDPSFQAYYKNWNDEYWRNREPVFLPPSVMIPGKFPVGYAGHEFRTNDNNLREIRSIELRVDFNRRDAVIKRDFNNIVDELRKENPDPPPRVHFRIADWLGNHILEVWDLKQYQVSWSYISDLLSLNGLQSARNAYNAAKRLIDRKQWLELARIVETG